MANAKEQEKQADNSLTKIHNARRDLRTRRIAAIAAVVLAIAAINFLWYYPILQELNRNTETLFTTIAENAGKQISGFINSHVKALEDISAAIIIDPDFTVETLARLSRENLAIESVAVIGRSGQELFRRERTRLVTMAELRFRLSDTAFRYANEGSFFVGSVFISELGDPLVTLAVPLGVKSDVFAEEMAVLVADINIRFLVNIVRDISFGSTGLVYVVDNSGFLIAHSNTSLVSQRINLLDRLLVEEVLSKKQSSTFDADTDYRNFEDEEVFAVGLPVEVGSGWGVFSEQISAEALSSQNRAFTAAGLSIFIEIIFAAFLYWLYSSLIKTTVQLDAEKGQREAILNSLADGVLEYDANSRIILINPAAEKLLKIKRSDVEGLVITPDIANNQPALKNVVGIMYPALAQYASGVKAVPDSNVKTMEVHLPDGETKLQVTLTQVKDAQNNTAGFLKILHDISRERMFVRLRSEFVSIAAHQLRTPLSAIKWTLRLLLDKDTGELNKEQEELLKRGYDTNERMIKLVGDLLNAARIEEGRFGYDFKELDIENFIKGIVEGVDLEAKSREISIKFEKTIKEKIRSLYADSEKLGLAFNNLIDNAIKYTPKGGKVKISLGKRDDKLEVKISDSGVGIPENEQKRIFSKFFRASNVIKMETDGTGLGLFIVHNIIKRHGGDIYFESKEGKGTTFYLILPLDKESVPIEENVPTEEFLGGV